MEPRQLCPRHQHVHPPGPVCPHRAGATAILPTRGAVLGERLRALPAAPHSVSTRGITIVTSGFRNISRALAVAISSVSVVTSRGVTGAFEARASSPEYQFSRRIARWPGLLVGPE